MPSILTYNAPRIAVILKANAKGLEDEAMVQDDDKNDDSRGCGSIVSPFEPNLVPLKVIISTMYLV
jgi:hypothetical protein